MLILQSIFQFYYQHFYAACQELLRYELDLCPAANLFNRPESLHSSEFCQASVLRYLLWVQFNPISVRVTRDEWMKEQERGVEVLYIDILCSYTVKKVLRYSRPQPDCHLSNSPFPGRE